MGECMDETNRSFEKLKISCIRYRGKGKKDEAKAMIVNDGEIFMIE